MIPCWGEGPVWRTLLGGSQILFLADCDTLLGSGSLEVLYSVWRIKDQIDAVEVTRVNYEGSLKLGIKGAQFNFVNRLGNWVKIFYGSENFAKIIFSLTD